MTRFARSSEVSNVVSMIVPVPIVITRHELECAKTSADVVLLTEKKRVQALGTLKQELVGLEFDVQFAKDLFDETEGAPV